MKVVTINNPFKITSIKLLLLIQSLHNVCLLRMCLTMCKYWNIASILNWLHYVMSPNNWPCIFLPISGHDHILLQFFTDHSHTSIHQCFIHGNSKTGLWGLCQFSWSSIGRRYIWDLMLHGWDTTPDYIRWHMRISHPYIMTTSSRNLPRPAKDKTCKDYD